MHEEEDAYFFEDYSDSVLRDDQLACLLSFNSLIVTSHQAFFTEEAMNSIAEITMSNLHDYFTGAELKNKVA